jgi:transcriptional regulator with XRE-family HTH domain
MVKVTQLRGASNFLKLFPVQPEVPDMSHPVDVHVGKKIKQMRALRRLSQTDVAQKLNLSFQQIQKYEIGSNRVAASRLYELSKIFGVPTSYFFEGLPEDDSANDNQSLDAKILDAVSSIEDEAVKTRIATFIEDVAGVSVQRRAS